MKNRAKFSCSVALGCVLSVIAAVQVVVADSASQNQDQTAPASARTAFVYQGQLRDASGPVNGLFDVRFSLYTTQAGEQAIQSVEYDGLALTNGLFGLQLDFGAVAQELSEGWLEVAVRAHGSADSYTALTPRQKLTSTPYAIWAQAESWSLIGVPIGFPGSADSDAVLTDGMADQAGADAKKGREPMLKDKNSLKDHIVPGAATTAALATAGAIPKFTGVFNQIAESVMFDINGNIGVGTTSPGSKLDVAGTAQLRGAAGGTGLFVNSSGNVGIGTTNPQRALQIGPGSDTMFTFAPSDASPNAGYIRFGNGTGWQLHIGRSRQFSAGPLNTGTTGVIMTIRDNSVSGFCCGTVIFKGSVQLDGIHASGASPTPLCRNSLNLISECSSSLRYKTDIKPFAGGLRLINLLQPVSFTWKTDAQPGIGLIAEEVAQVEPRLTFKNQDGEIEGVKYELLTVVLVNAIKQQQEQLQQQQHLIEQLQSRLTRLERMNKQR